MKTFKHFISEAYVIVEKRGGEPKYSDEHANINFYNHLVSSPEVRELIRKKDFDAVNTIISQELESAKTDPEHPLHFNNAADEGFSGKQKTSAHENAYYSEIERAVPGFLSLVQSKKGGNIASKGWVGRVSGGEHEASKPSWKGNVKGQGRFDYVFSDPEDSKKQHRVSGKDYRGSQAGSAQADQATATLERGVQVAAQQQVKNILANKPKKKSGETEQEYKERVAQLKVDARKKGKEIISTSQETLNRIKELMSSTKGMSPQQQKDVYTQVQSEIDGLEKKVPGVQSAAGQEMVKGTGQFPKSKTAQSMWTTGGEGASFRDPRQQSVGLRARAGKGGGREMAVAGDIQAAPKEKAAQKTRQSSFALFNRQAQASHAKTAAELEQQTVQTANDLEAAKTASADATRVTKPDGTPVPRKNAFYLQNNPVAAQQQADKQAAAAQNVQAAQDAHDAAVTTHQTHLSTPPTPPTSEKPKVAQPKQPIPAPTPQPTQAPTAAPQPTQSEPTSTQPQQTTQPAPTPQEDPKEKRKRNLEQRMASAAQRNNLE
jgi:hypothetical protein